MILRVTRPEAGPRLCASGDIVHFVGWFTNLGASLALKDGRVRRKLLLCQRPRKTV